MEVLEWREAVPAPVRSGHGSHLRRDYCPVTGCWRWRSEAGHICPSGRPPSPLNCVCWYPGGAVGQECLKCRRLIARLSSEPTDRPDPRW